MISERNMRILAAFPRHRAKAPNDVSALEAAALELVPEAKTMPREQLYSEVIHPALIELGAQKLRNGTPVRVK